MFFVFKQKVAYEMRISDWSSDVCSSDLRLEPGAQALRFRSAFEQAAKGAAIGPGIMGEIAARPQHQQRHAIEPRAAEEIRYHVVIGRADRQRVVTGKSESERVDLVGRRVIKKKIVRKQVSKITNN